jgi:adenylosuccinate synthase
MPDVPAGDDLVMELRMKNRPKPSAMASSGMADRHHANRAPRATVELQGWRQVITEVLAYADLPGPARAYIEYVQEAVGIPIGWVSVGPERSQLIEIQ